MPPAKCCLNADADRCDDQLADGARARAGSGGRRTRGVDWGLDDDERRPVRRTASLRRLSGERAANRDELHAHQLEARLAAREARRCGGRAGVRVALPELLGALQGRAPRPAEHAPLRRRAGVVAPRPSAVVETSLSALAPAAQALPTQRRRRRHRWLERARRRIDHFFLLARSRAAQVALSLVALHLFFQSSSTRWASLSFLPAASTSAEQDEASKASARQPEAR